MSLIQEALEKTNRAPSSQAKGIAAKSLAGDPLGAHLEKELTRVQQDYAQRRALYRKWGIAGTVLLCAAGLLFSFGSLSGKQALSPGKAPEVLVVRPAVAAPQNYFHNVPFRLTGITNVGGEAMALIDGQIVKVGESLSGKAVVRSIGDGAVLLDVRGKQVRLEL